MTKLRMTSIAGTTFVVLAALGTDATGAVAQSIASKVARVTNGTVRMTFAAKPGICGSGNSIRSSNGRGRTTWSDGLNNSPDVEWESDCNMGPARVVLDRRGGELTDLRFYVGGRWRPAAPDVVDIGTVPAREAADYLLSIVQNDRGSIGRKAIFPATIADSAEIWPTLIRIARNPDLPRESRTQSVFWLGQAAGDAATANLNSLVLDNSVDREVREQAVFALSQRPHDEGVPALIAVAKTNKDPEIRKKALFWLGQSGDPRALDLFEQLLTKK
ncbi:MAG TPA: HEAT repeat domain-containing protein [Gemmatimonadaceae bacterium]|nr:HEAT repeat domain-containing protein [Gemmatimonadaceae bacterium]